jgi:HEAT repeat protein
MTSRESNISDLNGNGPHSGIVVGTPPQVKRVALVGFHLHRVRVRLPREDSHLPLFGPPNVDRLKARGDAPGLIKALEYQKLWRVRRDAAAALGQIGDADAVEPLIAGLQDDNPSVRRAAAEALGQIGDVSALGPLIAALKSPAVDVRKTAAEALGQIGDAGSLGPLLAALKDASWSVRRAAAESLGQIGDADAVEPLKVAFEDQDSNVRRAAGAALAALGWQQTGTRSET